MTKIPRLFELLKEKNITRKELTQATGISSGNISDWKSGRSKPSADKLSLLASFFDVSVDYLLGCDDAKAETDNFDENILRLAEMLSTLSDSEMSEVERFIDFLVSQQKRGPE